MNASSIAAGVLLIVLAVVIDALRAGSRSWGDAVALVFLTLGVFRVCAGSPIAESFEAWLSGATAGALSGANVGTSASDVRPIVTALVSILAVIAVLSVIPPSLAGARLKLLAIRFNLDPRQGWRLNWKVYALGLPLGLLAPTADIPGTAVLIVVGAWSIGVDFFAELMGRQ